MANKLCKKCKQTKPMSDFYKANHYKYENDGFDYYCKYCRKGTHLRSLENNKKQCSIDNCNRAHYAKEMCRMHWARFDRNGTVERKIRIVKDGIYLHNGTKTGTRAQRLKSVYNITLEQFNAMAANGCQICSDTPEATLQVDHDHTCCPGRKSCGKCVRGVVCNKCNVAIDKLQFGIMRGDYPNYDKIKKYLEASNG